MDRLIALLSRFSIVAAAPAEDQLAQVAELSDDDLADLDAEIRAHAADAELEELAGLADAADVVRAEAARRDTLRRELLDRIGADEEPEPDGGTEPEPEPVAAAAAPTRRRVPAALRPRPSQPRAPRLVSSEGVPLSLQAAGDLFASRAAMGTAGRVLSLRSEWPEDRFLTADSGGNAEKIGAVVASLDETLRAGGPDALTAAGGICAPEAPRYAVEGITTARRPLRDSLVNFGADRGGIQYARPIELADVDAAVGIWTSENDADPGSAGPTTKPCLTVECGDTLTEQVDAVTLCLQVGNFNRRTWPERWGNFFETALSEHAREAEDRLWNTMCSLSTAVTAGSEVLGAARDILVVAARAAAGLRYRYRTDENQTVQVWFPDHTIDIMQADLTRQLPGDQAIAATREEIKGYFAARNIMPSFSPDGGGQGFGVEAGGALQEWPQSIEIIVGFPGTFLFLDGGTLDLGTEIRDSTLIGTNDVRAFLETFENVVRVGHVAFCVNMAVCPSGETAATADTSALCTTGS